jgi:DNA-directed RNA polymerase subunit RPC12/RpoP
LHKNGFDIRSWNDGYRILLEFPFFLSKKDVDRFATMIFSLSPEEAERSLINHIKTGAPFSYYQKFVAERFGAIPRGLMLSEEELANISSRFTDTPIFKETIREALVEKIDLENMKAVFQRIASGEISIETRFSYDRPTPISFHILNKFIEIPELIAPRTIEWDSVRRLKEKTLSSHVYMLCMNCGAEMYKTRLRDLKDAIVCIRCSARLIHVSPYPDKELKKIITKHLRKSKLTSKEKEILIDAGRNADLVLSYGKRAATALLVFGIGPQTAARILKSYEHEDEFFRQLLEAKLTFLRSRPFWNSD